MGFFDDFWSGSSVPSASWLPGMAVEIVFLLVVYRLLFFSALRAALEQQFSKASWWSYLLTFNGLFCQNVQKEIVYVTILGIHHLIGGALMFAGAMYGSSALWLQGFIVEIVDDVHDLGLMLIPAWPFAGGPGEKRDMKIVALMSIHHAFGILAVVPVVLTGLFANSYVQTMGWSLLLAGGVSCFVLAVNRTIDRNTPDGAWKTFGVWMSNLSFYYYCRFWVYPRAVYGLYSTGWATMDTSTRAVFVLATTLMSLFNVAIGADGTMQAVGLFMNAWQKLQSFPHGNSLTQPFDTLATSLE